MRIVAFQKVIHKPVALFYSDCGNYVFWAIFRGTLQESANTEIILGFPECVQGDMAPCKAFCSSCLLLSSSACKRAESGKIGPRAFMRNAQAGQNN